MLYLSQHGIHFAKNNKKGLAVFQNCISVHLKQIDFKKSAMQEPTNFILSFLNGSLFFLIFNQSLWVCSGISCHSWHIIPLCSQQLFLKKNKVKKFFTEISLQSLWSTNIWNIFIELIYILILWFQILNICVCMCVVYKTTK